MTGGRRAAFTCIALISCRTLKVMKDIRAVDILDIITRISPFNVPLLNESVCEVILAELRKMTSFQSKIILLIMMISLMFLPLFHLLIEPL